ncbi:MAG TPA: ABC transporter substrate-binding protein [Gaiellaceae bacterium]|nr:ABC transporter substrate-binding protein [Gaiellaceae bacterium]
MSASNISSLDPAIDYTISSQAIFGATCATLVTFPDTSASVSATLVPEAASGLPQISNGGRTYTFSIRPGFGFDTGEAVTAQNFAWALNRDLAPAMHSPAAGFLRDVVGAAAVLRGSATSASGIAASGDTLRVTLVRSAPDFVARMAMSFFCAIPLGTPASPQGYVPIPMAGPYYIASVIAPVAGRGSVVLKENPSYGGTRPHHLSEIDFTLGTDATTSVLQIAQNGADYDAGTLDPRLLRSLEAQHRLGTAQLSVHPDLQLLFLALNTKRPLFRNARLRKAVNLAIDRVDILSRTGLYGKATDQILPAAMPGYRDVKIYPLTRPDLRSARRLVGSGTRHALFYFGGSIEFTIAEVVASQLAKIGIQVDVEPYPGGSSTAAAQRADITIVDWAADYVDPYDFINILLYGKTANAPGSQNRGGFASPLYDRRMTQAAALTGRTRLTAYAQLDAELMRNAAPIAPIADIYLPTLTSERVRPDCSLFPPQGAGLDLAAACLK